MVESPDLRTLNANTVPKCRMRGHLEPGIPIKFELPRQACPMGKPADFQGPFHKIVTKSPEQVQALILRLGARDRLERRGRKPPSKPKTLEPT